MSERAWIDRLAADLAATVNRKTLSVQHGESEVDLNDGRLVGLTTRSELFATGLAVVARLGFSGDGGRYYEFGVDAWRAACESTSGALAGLIGLGVRALLDHAPESEGP